MCRCRDDIVGRAEQLKVSLAGVDLQISISVMKVAKWIAVGMVALVSAMSVSCGSLPELPEQDLGPKSEHSAIPWNRRLPGEGQGILGGFSQ